MIGLVSCSAQKLDRSVPARALYCAPLFQRNLAYAEDRCTRVYVLSAAHGLVDLDDRVAPYDRRLGGKSEREAWARRVAGTLVNRHGGEVDYLLAGQDYAGPIAATLRAHDGYRDDARRGVPVDKIHAPLAGLQIGARLRWLNLQVAAGVTA